MTTAHPTSHTDCRTSNDGQSATARLRVAAIVPVYRATYLASALQSILRQTRPPDEIIVVDDGSPDEAEITRAVARFADSITLIRQPNQGAAAARNRGIAATNADFVALLDADDEWLPTFLAEQLTVFDANPSVDLVYSDGVITGQTGLAGQRFMTSCPSEGPVTLESLLAQRCTVLLSAVVARRQAIVDTGGFDLAIRRGQDFDLWLRMSHQGARFTYQKKVLILRRYHEDNLSGTAINEQERPLQVLEKTVRHMSLSPQERMVAESRIRYLHAALARERGKEFLQKGHFAAARREFGRARSGGFSWKIEAALLGLHIAPALVRKLYLVRTSVAPSSFRPVRHAS